MKAEAFLLVGVALLTTCCSRVGGRLVRPVPGRVFDASARPPSGCQDNGALPDAVELPRARMLWRRVGADLTISGTPFDKGLLRAAGQRIMVGGGASVDARTGQQWEGAAEAGHASRNVDFDASGERRAPLAVVPADPAELRRAIVLMTVLGPPRALDPPGR